MTLPDSGMLLHSWRIVVPRDPRTQSTLPPPCPTASAAGWIICEA
jgi:hypothetical protein